MKIIAFLLPLLLLTAAKPQEKITVFLTGDSTCAQKKEEKRPETGWGEKIGLFFNNNVVFSNHAQNGRSTRTFLEEGRWDSVMKAVKPGDYVFIQFGHNDQSKNKTDRYTPPQDFERNLRRFVQECRDKKALPVLLTPVCRRKFNEYNFVDAHGQYPAITRKVAREMQCPLIDMHTLSMALLVQYGEEDSKKLFLHCAPAQCPNYPEGKEDNTHFNDHGAYVMAQALAKAIQESEIALKLAANVPPAN